MWGQTKNVDDAWLLFSWFNSDDWYGIQSRLLQPARLSWLPKWQTMLTQTYPALQGKSLKAFTVGAEQGFGKPWELHRYHRGDLPPGPDRFRGVGDPQPEAGQGHPHRGARQVNEIQAKEHAAKGGK